MTLRPLAAAATAVLGLAIPLFAVAAPALGETSTEPPTEVAIVVPLTAPAHSGGLLDADTLADYTSPTGVLTRELDEVVDRPVTLGIDPLLIASIRVLGTSAPESAVLWLERLAAATNDTFPLTWADSDITAGLQAGATGVLAPLSLDFAIDPDRFDPPGEQPSQQPSADPEGEDQTGGQDAGLPLPTGADLVAWDYTLPSFAWPVADTVGASDLATLAETFDHTLLASSNVATSSSRAAAATIGDASVIVADAKLSALFSATVAANPGLDWETAVATLGVSLGTTAPTVTSLVITLDRAVDVADTDLGPTIDAITSRDDVAVVGLGELAGATGGTATLLDLQQDPNRSTTVRTLLLDETAEWAFLVIAENPELISAERRLELLSVLGSRWRTDAAGWLTAVERFRSDSSAIVNSVSIVRSSDITLWADRGSLPVVVDNKLDQAVTVYVRVSPSSPLLRVEDSFVELTIEPNSQRKAQVPVQSVSNGEVDLEITVHQQDMTLIGAATHVRTTVQAGWETPFTIAAAVVVVLVFAGGIVRTILRRRRLAREAG